MLLDGYGLCFQSAVEIHAWPAMKEVSFLAHNRREDIFRHSISAEEVSFHIGQKIDRSTKEMVS